MNICKYDSNNVDEIRKHLNQHVSKVPETIKIVKYWRYNHNDTDTDNNNSEDDNGNTDEE